MSGYVYAIGIVSTQYVKIGHAGSPKRRLAALQSSLPFKLELLYTLKVEDPRSVERALHDLLADSRVRGEWFELPERPLSELFAEALETAPWREPLSPWMIGSRVASARRRIGITQKELARRAGCSVKTLSYIETGETEGPDARIIAGIARSLGVSCDYLLGVTDELVVAGEAERR